MKEVRLMIFSILVGALTACPVWAGDWHKVGDGLVAKGDAKELTVNREITQFQISVDEGTVVINSVWVRNGADRREIRVGRAFQKGEKTDIDIGGKQNVTGLRVGDSGGGKYNIWVK